MAAACVRRTSLRHNPAMTPTPQELVQRLAEAEAAQAELQALIDVLLREGEAVFASRRWRLGAALLRPLEALLRVLGRPLPPAQDAAHWHALVQAQRAAIAQRAALLAQLQDAGARELPEALAALQAAAARARTVVPP